MKNFLIKRDHICMNLFFFIGRACMHVTLKQICIITFHQSFVRFDFSQNLIVLVSTFHLVVMIFGYIRFFTTSVIPEPRRPPNKVIYVLFRKRKLISVRSKERLREKARNLLIHACSTQYLIICRKINLRSSP